MAQRTPYAPPGGKLTFQNYNAIADWFRKATPEQKQGILDLLGEAAGGILGGIAGAPTGVGAVLGAGAGAVVGKKLVSEPLGRALGVNKNPTVVDNAMGVGDPWANQKDTLSTLGSNAAGEGIGRAVPMVGRAAKNALKARFQPDSVTRSMNTLADKYGIPLTLGERSGKPIVQMTESWLDRLPFSSGKIRDFRNQQYQAFEDGLNKSLDNLHAGRISPDDFQVQAEAAYSQLRAELNKRMDQGAAKASAQFNPNRVTPAQAIESAKASRQENLAAVSKWANKAYGDIRQAMKGADIQVDLSNIGDDLQEISQNARQLFSPKTNETIGAAERLSKPLSTGDAEYTNVLEATAKQLGLSDAAALKEKFPTVYDETVSYLESRGLKPQETAPQTISFQQAMELRTRLIESASRLNGKSASGDKRAVNSVLANLQTAIDASVDAAEKSLDPAMGEGVRKSFTQLKQVNKKYAEFMRKLTPARGKKDAPNIGADLLENADNPDYAWSQAVNSPSLKASVDSNVAPSAVGKISDISKRTDPRNDMARAMFDETVSNATVEDLATGTSRISPTKMAGKLPDTAESFFGVRVPYIKGLSKPKLVAREEALYGRGLPKATDGGSGNQALSAAFPPTNPGRANETLSLMGEVSPDAEAIARRAYGDKLLDSSLLQAPNMGPGKYVSGVQLHQNLNNAGDTAKTVLGDQYEPLREIADLGQQINYAEKKWGNASGTMRGYEIAQAGGGFLGGLGGIVTGHPALGALAAGGVAAKAALSRGAAELATNQKVVKGLTSALEPAISGASPKVKMMGATGVLANSALGNIRSGEPQDPDVIYLDEEKDPDVIYLNQ